MKEEMKRFRCTTCSEWWCHLIVDGAAYKPEVCPWNSRGIEYDSSYWYEVDLKTGEPYDTE